MQEYGNFKDRSAHVGNLFVTVGNAEPGNKMASCTTFTLLMFLVLLRRDNIFEFLLVLHRRVTLSIGLLASLKEQEVSGMKVRREV